MKYVNDNIQHSNKSVHPPWILSQKIPSPPGFGEFPFHHSSRASSSSSSRPKLFSEYINVNAEAKPRGTARARGSGLFPCRFCWKAASKKISRTCKQLVHDSKTCSCFYVNDFFLISSCSNLISSSKGLHLKNPMLKSLKCSCSVHSKKPPHVRCWKILNPNNIFGHPPSRLIPSIAVST